MATGGRPRHPDKDIEDAVQYAENHGWTWRSSHGHPLGNPSLPVRPAGWMSNLGLVDTEKSQSPCTPHPARCRSMFSYRGGGAMSTTTTQQTLVTHSFTLIFAGTFDDLTDEFLNAIYEAGCDDSTVAIRAGVLRIAFDREAPSFRIALFSAISDVERAGLGLELIRVEMD